MIFSEPIRDRGSRTSLIVVCWHDRTVAQSNVTVEWNGERTTIEDVNTNPWGETKRFLKKRTGLAFGACLKHPAQIWVSGWFTKRAVFFQGLIQ